MPKFGGRRIALRFKYYFNSNLIQRGGSNRVARAEHQIKRDTKISYCCKDTFFFFIPLSILKFLLQNYL